MPYIGRGPELGVRSRFIYTATANQTSFTGNDDAGISLAYTDTLYMDVYQNGVLLVPATDYAATTGTSVVLVQGASADDTVELLVFDIFSVADAVSAKDGGTFSGSISAADITASATLNAQGDTAAGDNAAMGFTAAEGLILTGQGSTNDVTIKNDADADVISIPTGTTNVAVAGTLAAGNTTLTVADNSDVLSLVSTDADAASGPGLELYRNSASGASSDFGGKISFYMEDANSDKIRTVAMFTRMSDATNGSEDGELYITTMTAGTERDKFHIYPTETVFNEDSVDQDFRIESNGVATAFVLDGGSGDVYIGGANSSGPAAGATFSYQSGNGMTLNIGHPTGAGSGYSFQLFSFNNSAIGSISQNGTTATGFNTSSDYRLKENVDYTWDATTRLKQLKPARFNFINDPDRTVDGFLAHEVSSVVPLAITGTKDAVDEDGAAVMQQIDHSFLVPLLVKTIQELEARITALEA